MPVMKPPNGLNPVIAAAKHAELQRMVKMAAGRAAGTPLRRPPVSVVPGLTPTKVAQGIALQKAVSSNVKPISLAVPVRASPPNPSNNLPSNQILRPQAPSAARLKAPIKVTGGSFQRVPVGATLQGFGMAGVPVAVSPLNGAPIAVSPVGSSYINSGLGANADTSVSGQVRAKKALMDAGVPVSGDYTDAIRQAAGFAFGPKRMPKQGFMAASYSYPAQQMVVGSTLSGQPIVAMSPVVSSSPRPAPRLVTRAGSVRGQISSSPSEERRKLLSTLQGLGGFGAINWDQIDQTRISSGVLGFGADSEDGITCSDINTCRQVKVIRVRKALSAAGKDPNNDEAVNFYGATKWNSIDTLTSVIRETWDARFLRNQKLDDVHYASGFSKWVSDWATKKGQAAADAALKAGAGLATSKITGGGASTLPAYGSYGGGAGTYGGGYAQTIGTKRGMSSGTMIGLGVAGVAAIGAIAYVAMKK